MSIGVWGAGAEGLSMANMLQRNGLDLLVVDEAERTRPQGLDPSINFTAGRHALPLLLSCDTVIMSPGVPKAHPFRSQLRTAGVNLSSATAWWMDRAGHTTIGVTGSKGKSTTSTLIQLLLQSAGVKAQLGGNIGLPLTELDMEATATVAELSSYQCASLQAAPRISVITSLYEDHLTWHGSKHAYWLDKARIAGIGCETLVCDGETLAVLRTLDIQLPSTIALSTSKMQVRLMRMQLPMVLQRQQNLANLTLAVLAVESWLKRPLNEAEIVAAAAAFVPLPHRLECVAEKAGLTWIDDTLSTIPESVIAAAQTFSGPIVLIVGGDDRGVPYDALTKYLLTRQPLATVIAIPGNGWRIVADYERVHPQLVHHVVDLPAAVQLAATLDMAGATVLLSPGAPSYDRYRNFEHKSAAYLEAIRELGT